MEFPWVQHCPNASIFSGQGFFLIYISVLLSVLTKQTDRKYSLIFEFCFVSILNYSTYMEKS